MIRIATGEDAAAFRAIYLPHVRDGVATFEMEPPGVDAMRERVLARLRHYPWLVWADDGEILAYAYASRFRDRAAYDWIAETSIYVHPDAQRRGIARRLYGCLLDTLRLQGIQQAVGVITLPGSVSIAAHQAMGFVPAGVWHRAGYKLGQWWDVGVWQKALGEPLDPPQAVTPFEVLRTTPKLQALLVRA